MEDSAVSDMTMEVLIDEEEQLKVAAFNFFNRVKNTASPELYQKLMKALRRLRYGGEVVHGEVIREVCAMFHDRPELMELFETVLPERLKPVCGFHWKLKETLAIGSETYKRLMAIMEHVTKRSAWNDIFTVKSVICEIHFILREHPELIAKFNLIAPDQYSKLF
jgi:histone deacetylase complex regulatory component SIN3